MAFSLVASMACASCSLEEVLGGGKVSFTSYPPVTTATSAAAPASTTVPSDFPREIPVVKGFYSPEPSPLGDAKAMTVAGVNRSALPEAKKLLAKADYMPMQAQGMDIFLGPDFAVMVSGDDSTGAFRLHYVAFPIGNMQGIPRMPTVTFPTLFPQG